MTRLDWLLWNKYQREQDRDYGYGSLVSALVVLFMAVACVFVVAYLYQEPK